MIKFYKTKEEYGCFSNFSRHAIICDSVLYQTSEHYYQAQKFTDEQTRLKIINSPSPKIAADLGRDKSFVLREDWDQVKISVMYDVLKMKVDQHPEILEKLLNSGDQEIVEDSPIDYFWGNGKDNSGKNHLGKLWIQIREEYRNK